MRPRQFYVFENKESKKLTAAPLGATFRTDNDYNDYLVIEYSAYEALEKESKINQEGCKFFGAENNKLLKKLASLEAKLAIVYEVLNKHGCTSPADCGLHFLANKLIPK